MENCDHIFLVGQWQGGAPGDIVEVPAESLVALFTLQYCQNTSLRVVLVPNRVDPATCVFPVSLSSLSFRVMVREEVVCPGVLCHCELPAMVSIVKEEEEENGIRSEVEKEEKEEKVSRLAIRKEDQEEENDEKKEEEEEEIVNGLVEKEEQEDEENERQKEEKLVNRLEVKEDQEEENKQKEEEEKEDVDRLEEEKEDQEEEKGRQEEKEKQNRKKNREKNQILKIKKNENVEENNKEQHATERMERDTAWREGPWCCAGLCSSLRLAVKQITTERGATHHAAALLGFRGGCLQACAEVSVWTKFCEVEAPSALLSAALAPYGKSEEVIYPHELLRYECHLRRPPILHNALKRTQRHIRETVQDSTQAEEMCRRPLAKLPPLTHQFAEGPDMTLADLMLFACFHILLSGITAALVTPETITPLVAAWHGTMVRNSHVIAALPVLKASVALLSGTGRSVAPRVMVPTVPDVSIYKSDPERCKASRGAFTRQGDVEEVLRVVEDAKIIPQYISSSSLFSSSASNTHSLHSLMPALSLEGHIPQSRLERKMQQVENMCNAVLALTQPGDIVVDFCSGGGHVGIPLAQCLPQCRILLVENKVASLLRARDRVRSLRLHNVSFVQTNLDYFRGGFNVGVSLHACGAATDLVLRKCVSQRAAFVVTPCCYGSIRPNHVVSYPRSKTFCGLSLTLDQYLTLGHAADQTHGQDNPKTEQGQRCMRLVDEDRLGEVREAGYLTALALMNPPSCSPKNHLLLGKPLT